MEDKRGSLSFGRILRVTIVIKTAQARFPSTPFGFSLPNLQPPNDWIQHPLDHLWLIKYYRKAFCFTHFKSRIYQKSLTYFWFPFRCFTPFGFVFVRFVCTLHFCLLGSAQKKLHRESENFVLCFVMFFHFLKFSCFWSEDFYRNVDDECDFRKFFVRTDRMREMKFQRSKRRLREVKTSFSMVEETFSESQNWTRCYLIPTAETRSSITKITNLINNFAFRVCLPLCVGWLFWLPKTFNKRVKSNHRRNRST